MNSRHGACCLFGGGGVDLRSRGPFKRGPLREISESREFRLKRGT